jgi:hypothetical protein
MIVVVGVVATHGRDRVRPNGEPIVYRERKAETRTSDACDAVIHLTCFGVSGFRAKLVPTLLDPTRS